MWFSTCSDSGFVTIENLREELETRYRVILMTVGAREASIYSLVLDWLEGMQCEDFDLTVKRVLTALRKVESKNYWNAVEMKLLEEVKILLESTLT